jgi:hypothetical protein
MLGLKRKNRLNVPNDLKKKTKLAAKSSRVCPTCHKTQFYVEQNQAWYCFECKAYEHPAIVEAQIRRDDPMTPIFIKTQINKTIQIEKPIQKQQTKIQLEKPKRPITFSEQRSLGEFSCPQNLEYFHQNPRPKQMPTECFSCKSLIQCVCITSK